MRLARVALAPFAFAYGTAAQLRIWLYDKGWLRRRRLEHPVISVGNLSLGGTGKTPMVLWLAARFLQEGKRVAILSRGYRGSRGSSDEVELMKRRLGDRVLFGVGKDRYANGKRLEAQGAQLFLLDDGFQHTQLTRDVDIVLLDTMQPASEHAVLPAGRLREPMSSLQRADLVVCTRADRAERTTPLIQGLKSPVFAASTELQGFRRLGGDQNLMTAAELGAGPYFAFCGIGNPRAFFLDLKRWGIPVAGERAFRDHHRYRTAEARELQDAAERAGAKGLVTTEKDFFNLAAIESWRVPVYVCVIGLRVSGGDEFFAAIGRKLAAQQGAPE